MSFPVAALPFPGKTGDTSESDFNAVRDAGLAQFLGKQCICYASDSDPADPNMSRSSEADFTAYIFKQDINTLSGWASSAGSVGGNLYGLWTSTGNPVIHVVERSTNESVCRNLEERYKMSHLGEWLFAAFGTRQDGNKFDTIANDIFPRVSKRFLALVVGKAAEITITPYLFVDGHLCATSMEVIKGSNPFTDDLDTKRILEGTYRPADHSHHSRHEQHSRYPPSSRTTVPTIQYRHPADHREAQTYDHQWYSGKKGEEDLHYVFEELKKEAHTEVQMYRDKATQDCTMSFNSGAGKQWQVEFSCGFPETGAKVVRVHSPTRTQLVADVRGSDFKRAVKDIVKEVRY